MNPYDSVSFIYLYCQLHATLSSHPLTSIVTQLIDIITAIDHHLFRSLLLSPSLFLWIVCSGALFITWIGNWTIKTHTIFSFVKSGNQTRHIYFQHQRLTLLLLPTPPLLLSPTYRSLFRRNRRHTRLRHHTHTFRRYIFRFGTSSRIWSTPIPLNNKQRDRLHCYVETPSTLLYSSLFIFIHFCLHSIHLSHHFYSATIFTTFTHLESQFYSLISSVACNVIVTSARLHRHSTHRHYHCHWSSSLPFIFIVTFTPSMNRLFRCSVHYMNRKLDS